MLSSSKFSVARKKKEQRHLLWNNLVSALMVCQESDWSGLMSGASAVSACRYAWLNYLKFYGYHLLCSSKVPQTTLRWWILLIPTTLFISVCALMRSEGNSLWECTARLFIACVFLGFLAEVHLFLRFNESLSKDRLSNACSRSEGCGCVSGLAEPPCVYFPAPSIFSAIAVCGGGEAKRGFFFWVSGEKLLYSSVSVSSGIVAVCDFAVFYLELAAELIFRALCCPACRELQRSGVIAWELGWLTICRQSPVVFTCNRTVLSVMLFLIALLVVWRISVFKYK